jgi:hypothetical protein
MLPLLTACAGMDTYHITPARDTATITRVFATPEQVSAFCSKLVGKPLQVGCTVMVGDRAVQFLPTVTTSCVNGHETEHNFSGDFH